MSEEVQKKSGITFEYSRAEDNTTIIATANDHELPRVFTRVKLAEFNIWAIEVSLVAPGNYGYLFHGYCFRGRSFAEKLAREIIRGCFSRLGKHRRMTANKAKREEVKND